MRPRILVAGTLMLAMPLTLAACSSSSDAGAGDAGGSSIGVAASDSACELSESTAPAGTTAFAVTNNGDQVTEVYVYAETEDGSGFTTVVAEVENIGPGTSRDMTAELVAGTYEVACKPGQTGDGIRATLTVTGGASATASPAAAAREIALAIDASNALTGVEGQSATVGETVEFEVTNGATAERVFEVKRPDGSVAGEIEIAAGTTAGLAVETTAAGDWLLIVEGGDSETETPFTVG
jgi:iron uptake system component EfeO